MSKKKEQARRHVWPKVVLAVIATAAVATFATACGDDDDDDDTPLDSTVTTMLDQGPSTLPVNTGMTETSLVTVTTGG